MAVELSFLQTTALILIYSFCGIQSGLDSATSISTYPRISLLISPINKEEEDQLSENITTYYLVGSILAGIVFFFTKNWMRMIFIKSDIIIIIGYLLSIFSIKLTKNTLYISRCFVGYGTTTLNLVGPLMVTRNRPNGNLLLASFGLSYQLGQTISDFIVVEEWRYELLGPCVVALVQLILVSFTSKVVFECDGVLGETDSENTSGKICFAKSIAKACIIQLLTTMIGLKWVSNFGPKHARDLPLHSTPISIIGSIISIFLVKLFEIKKLLLSSFSILTLELVILAIFIPSSGERMKLILFSIYLFTFTSGLSSPPLVYTVKLFLPETRGVGLGLVSSVSETTYLIFILAINRLGLKISEKESIWILTVISFLALYPLSRFLRVRAKEDKDKDEDEVGGPDPEADIALEAVQKERLWVLTVISLLALYPLSRFLRVREEDEDEDEDEAGGPDPEADIALEAVQKERLWILTVISLLALYPLSRFLRVREEDEDEDEAGGPDQEADIALEAVQMISPK